MVFNYPISSESISSAEKFFWIDIAICYLVFFIPFFFSSISLKNIDTKITSTVHIWISVIIFEIVAIAFAVLSLTEVVNIRISVIVELVVFFLAAIFVFFGYFCSNFYCRMACTVLHMENEDKENNVYYSYYLVAKIAFCFVMVMSTKVCLYEMVMLVYKTT